MLKILIEIERFYHHIHPLFLPLWEMGVNYMNVMCITMAEQFCIESILCLYNITFDGRKDWLGISLF